MQFKLLIALTEDAKVKPILKAAREAGATGATVITSARGEGLRQEKTFLGLDLTRHRDIVILVVEEHLSRRILETIAEAGHFDGEPGSGIAFQVDIEDAIGLTSQIQVLTDRIEEEI
ncbi:MAG TPA: P-II family nitrogen regulator [Gammaproteobacteria bacterium]